MSRSKCRLLLHIGQHKTGSKALQSFLFHNRQRLREKGIMYPDWQYGSHNIKAYKISHYKLYALLRAEALAACGELSAAQQYGTAQSAYCMPFRSVETLFEALIREHSGTGIHKVILSAEDLFDMATAHETKFSLERISAAARIVKAAATRCGYETAVIVYLRRQDHLLAAHYAQYIKGSVCNTLDFSSFAAEFEPRLRYFEILQQWAEVFGRENLVVRPYERESMPGGIVTDFFEHAAGITLPDSWPVSEQDRETVNSSPGRDYIEFMRRLNSRGSKGNLLFKRADVLEAAFSDRPGQGNSSGIEAWLSPEQRCRLLERHAADNAQIANCYFKGHKLFSEAQPAAEDGGYRAYAGLSATRALAIAISSSRAAFLRRLKRLCRVTSQ